MEKETDELYGILVDRAVGESLDRVAGSRGQGFEACAMLVQPHLSGAG